MAKKTQTWNKSVDLQEDWGTLLREVTDHGTMDHGIAELIKKSIKDTSRRRVRLGNNLKFNDMTYPFTPSKKLTY